MASKLYKLQWRRAAGIKSIREITKRGYEGAGNGLGRPRERFDAKESEVIGRALERSSLARIRVREAQAILETLIVKADEPKMSL